eukprot:CAMPEP_0114146260 /NCGR_PEP_ID=MMETSP0043_2-20121206/20471_1 /TAXON_ID=464988 /ORGANISM="Hemiselmis andersenii, Strain CCMP644" /LENGTH=116 /DNA_ID=CAMNT_0001240705 /DNA_START=516 /DNA_END=866 /DNA_ORIENTATION=-
MNVGVGVDVTEVGKHLASWPGVGIVSLAATTKSKHAPSMVMEDAESMRRSDPLIPSTVAPSFALVSPFSEVGVTELRLGEDKPPVCIVLSEEIEEYLPCKRCNGGQSNHSHQSLQV